MGYRLVLRLLIAVVALEWAVSASAGDLGEFLSSVARDTKRRNCWPEPFIYADRDSQRQVIAVQINAGWERQNLLSEFHFAQGGTELTEAGRIRVQWIMNEASEPHRQVYVHRGNTPRETATRMQTVQRFVAQMAYGGNLIPVLESTRTDDGWPADRIDILNRKSNTATMEPKLLGSSGGAGSGH